MDYACDSTLRLITDQLRGLPEGGWTPEKVSEVVRQDVWPAIWQSEIGRTFKARYAYTDELLERFETEFARRFGIAGEVMIGTQWPGLHTAERCLEILSDLALSHDSCLTPLEDPEEPEKLTARTPEQEFAALCDQVRADIGDLFGGRPGISSLEIERKKNASGEYRRGFDFVMQSSVAQGYGKTLESRAKPEASAHVKQFAHVLNDEIHTRGVPRPAAGFYTLHAGDKEYKYSVSDFQRMSDEAVRFELVR